MNGELKARITRKYDSAEFLPGGSVRNVTVVEFVVERTGAPPNTFGPFTRTFERDVEKFTIDQAMDKEIALLRDRV
jgi:hypothetical protein